MGRLLSPLLGVVSLSALFGVTALGLALSLVAGRFAGGRCCSFGMMVNGCAGGGIIGTAGVLVVGAGGALRIVGGVIGAGVVLGVAGASAVSGTAGSTINVSRRKTVPSSFCTVTVHVPERFGGMVLLEWTRHGLPVTGNCNPSWNVPSRSQRWLMTCPCNPTNSVK